MVKPPTWKDAIQQVVSGLPLHRCEDVAPQFSPLIDLSLAMQYVSMAQAARVVLETWASFNLYCVNCENDALDRLRDNTPVADFKCFVCERSYQLKGKNGRFGDQVRGAAYAPTIAAIRENRMPEYLLVEYAGPVDYRRTRDRTQTAGRDGAPCRLARLHDSHRRLAIGAAGCSRRDRSRARPSRMEVARIGSFITTCTR
ncbi:MAG TPA: DpnI domain-containing protein [Candidatus Tumulicola sp.]